VHLLYPPQPEMLNLEAAGPFACSTSPIRKEEIMNAFLAQGPTSTAATPPQPGSEQASRERAYAIWEEEGRPAGKGRRSLALRRSPN
jgi:hypothetical protein